jgi:hypothetical protein
MRLPTILIPLIWTITQKWKMISNVLKDCLILLKSKENIDYFQDYSQRSSSLLQGQSICGQQEIRAFWIHRFYLELWRIDGTFHGNVSFIDR